jgi:hypothetical protein
VRRRTAFWSKEINMPIKAARLRRDFDAIADGHKVLAHDI